jgi:hypothetical protein
MAERPVVNGLVESSNLSSSAKIKCECANAGGLGLSVKQVPSGLISSNLITHTKERVRLVMDAVLKTDWV